jgi:type IV pilus assembly protein PilM
MGLFSKKSVVGIDLGHHTIKAVQLERHGQDWKVTKTISCPTPVDSIKDGVVIDQQSVTFALKAMLKEGHIHATAANIAIAGASVFVRPVKMPKMAEATLRKSIKFEASRYVPGSPEDCYIEFEILGPTEDGQMDVLIVAAPKDIVNSRVDAVEAAGLDVECVEIEAFSMFRSIIEADKLRDFTDTTVALVDIGASTTNLSVVSGGKFAMTRSIPHGGNVLTEALKTYFKLEAPDAEAGKAQLDLRELLEEGKVKENPPLRVLQPHVDELVREIRRSLNYYQSQQNEGAQAKQVDAIIVTGGGTKLSGLAEYVGHRLSLQVSEAGLYTNPRFVRLHPTEESGLDLAVASGLAMRSQSKAA